MLKRFSGHQRAAHFIGSISGLMLMITGLPLMFPKQLKWLLDALGGSEVTMFLHRVFAIILIFSFAYFALYFVLERAVRGRGDSNIKNFGFSWSFIREIFGGAARDILWTFKLVKERPRFGKYDWVMVADIYGMPALAFVQIITGTIMWFPRDFMWIVSVIFGVPENPALFFIARTIHAGVSFFLVMAIIAHTTILHFTPGRFPVDMSIFSGLMSKIRAKYEHQNWIDIAEEVKVEKTEKRANPACYVLGAIIIGEIVLLAYIPFIMYEEWFAGLRIGDSYLASIALGFAELLLIYYIVLSVVSIIRGVAKSV